MNKYLFTIFALLICIANSVLGQNINQNTVVINNQPVIKEKEYIIKYRPVYVDKPQPKRYARKLATPICLLNYLWIYPEDLGTFPTGPSEIINKINQNGLYGRTDWRVPTDDELRLMENYANDCGLGDGIYLSTSHRNGILRLVSTGSSIQEQRLIEREIQVQQERERHQAEKEAAAQRAAANRAIVQNQKELISSGQGIVINGIIWATTNQGANSFYDKGVAYSQISYSNNWRLPTETEFRTIVKQSTACGNYYKHSSGLIIPCGTYALQGGDYFMLPNMIVSSGNAMKHVRFVQDKRY